MTMKKDLMTLIMCTMKEDKYYISIYYEIKTVTLKHKFLK